MIARAMASCCTGFIRTLESSNIGHNMLGDARRMCDTVGNNTMS